MKWVATIATGSAVLTLLAVPAVAGPQTRTCRLVTDAADDSHATGSVGAVPMSSTDILSADLASEGTYITAAIRVKDLYARATQTDGIAASLRFTVGKSTFQLYGGESHWRGQEYTVWHQERGDDEHPTWGFMGYASGMFNDDDSTVYITATLKSLGLAAKGQTARKLRAEAGYGVDAGVTGGGMRTDDAPSDASYVFGSPSCSPVPVNPCRDPQSPGHPPQDPCPGGARLRAARSL